MASVGDLLASGGKWPTFVLRTAVLVTFVCIAYIGARERNQELLPASPDMTHFLLCKQGEVCQKHLKFKHRTVFIVFNFL